MVKLNRKQRVALKIKFDQDTQYMLGDMRPGGGRMRVMTYREFRSKVEYYLGGQGCVVVPWFNMWIGIETDGTTHS